MGHFEAEKNGKGKEGAKRNKQLSYRRETALQCALVLAKSRRLELGDNILWTL